MKTNNIKDQVKAKYSQLAVKGCCQSTESSCCAEDLPVLTNYSAIKDQVVTESDLGLGCGIPTYHAALQKGETVLDLGSGGGIDAFISAKAVGHEGKVIGVDITEEMIKKAVLTAKKNNITNVEFRLGDLEKLPVDNEYIDVILSNCVINLVPDKSKVFNEIFRVLKPGGRFIISDIVSTGNVPDDIRQKIELWVGCIAGALDEEQYKALITNTGFKDINVVEEKEIPYFENKDFSFKSITIKGIK